MSSPVREDGPGEACGAWTDSHCHLDRDEEARGALERAAETGVGRAICVGTGVVTSTQAVGLARRLVDAREAGAAGALAPLVWATVGLHPHDALDGLGPVEALLAEVAPDSGTLPGAGGALAPGSVVAVGECGLDYHYDHAPRAVQREVFADQVALAHRFGLSLVVHTREAWDDTIEILQGEGVPEHTIIHCFTGGVEEARRCLDLGAYLSFSGIVTFKNAGEVRAAAAFCPSDRLLVETDAPFLTPVPHRGTPNEPARVVVVGVAVAELRLVHPAQVAATTSANARRAFRI